MTIGTAYVSHFLLNVTWNKTLSGCYVPASVTLFHPSMIHLSLSFQNILYKLPLLYTMVVYTHLGTIV